MIARTSLGRRGRRALVAVRARAARGGVPVRLPARAGRGVALGSRAGRNGAWVIEVMQSLEGAGWIGRALRRHCPALAVQEATQRRSRSLRFERTLHAEIARVVVAVVRGPSFDQVAREVIFAAKRGPRVGRRVAAASCARGGPDAVYFDGVSRAGGELGGAVCCGTDGGGASDRAKPSTIATTPGISPKYANPGA